MYFLRVWKFRGREEGREIGYLAHSHSLNVIKIGNENISLTFCLNVFKISNRRRGGEWSYKLTIMTLFCFAFFCVCVCVCVEKIPYFLFLLILKK